MYPAKNSGVTLLELMVVISIFFLFLFAFYAALDTGLKSWKMGEVRADLKTKGELIMKRLVSELEESNPLAIDTGTFT